MRIEWKDKKSFIGKCGDLLLARRSLETSPSLYPVAEARNEYTYSASGAKLKVVHKSNSTPLSAPVINMGINTNNLDMIVTTDYVGNIIYENGALKRILIDDGYIENGAFYYFLKGHLGDNYVVANTIGSIIQKNQYYPFGMHFADDASPGTQPYKYNGKEVDQDHGLNLYDYSARFHDPAIGRFMTVDPLAEKYYSVSPYAYCNNNPIIYTDPSGLWPTKVHNRMITETFTGILSSDDMNILMKASKTADKREYQDPALSYRHGMGLKGLSREESEAEYNKFINGQFSLFLNAGTHEGALEQLGFALHAIMDTSSPTHNGFQIWKGFLKEKGFGLSHALGEQMKAYLEPANQAMINVSKEQMFNLVLKALAARGEINLLPEVTVTGSRSQKSSVQNSNKSFDERMQDMLWQSARPNSYGNTGRYNRPGRSTDNLYSDEFLKWYYEK